MGDGWLRNPADGWTYRFHRDEKSWLRDPPHKEAWSKDNDEWDEECSDYDSQYKEKLTKMQRRNIGSDRY